MSRTFLHRNKGKLLASLVAAALLFPVSANAWWGGYGYPGGGCDPQWAYLEEYGFLDPFGPSPTDLRRLNRDQWRAARYGYIGNYWRHDPVSKAMRRQCHGWRRPYHYW
ncbi:MAG: hypothetical protein PVI91_00205 [Gammaproteobacteria bacterium]|jgi:hypothetical protein